MRNADKGTGRPSVVAPPARITRIPAAAGGTNETATATTALRAISRPSLLRNGTAVRIAAHTTAAIVCSGNRAPAMASSHTMVSDEVSHQLTQSAFATGSPVRVRTTRSAVMKAIAV